MIYTGQIKSKWFSLFLFGLLGSVSFALGGAISSYLMLTMENPVVYGIQGGIGGAVLGLLMKDWRKAVLLSVIGTIGFSFGFSAGTFIALLWEPPILDGHILSYIVGGAIGGAFLGLFFWNWQKILILSMAGVFGFMSGAYLLTDINSLAKPINQYILKEQKPEATVNFDFRGINYPSWLRNEYSQSYSTANLGRLGATGANSVMIVPTWYMISLSDNRIRRAEEIPLSEIPPELVGRLEENWNLMTAGDDSVRKAIQDARAQGLRVALKPHVDPILEWRALINPSDPDAWFRNYEGFILHYAKMAEDEGVDMLVIGTELRSMTLPRFRGQWEAIISHIRGTYGGKITYGANASNPAPNVWTDFWEGNTHPDEYATCSFFDLLDYIGIDCFFPLTGKPNPSQEELLLAWQTNYEGYPIFEYIRSLNVKYQKPVIMTEIGYPDGNGGNTNPWRMPEEKYDLNYAEQANCLEAAFKFWNQQGDWFRGMFLWAWTVKPGRAFQHSPQYKPAENVIAKWYGGKGEEYMYNQAVSGAVQGALIGLAGGLVTALTFGYLVRKKQRHGH